MTASSERDVQVAYARIAPRYDRAIKLSERLLFRGGREWVASRAQGRTLEIGVGTARNLDAFSCGVGLVGIDVSPEMVAIGRARAERLGRPLTFLLADAQSLPFRDGCFDTVVSTLSLCTIPDERRALREASRVLRPGGRMVLLEHVRSPRALVRFVQRLLEPLFTRFACDHLLREPLEEMPACGLEVQELERSKWGIVERVVVIKPGRHASRRVTG